MKKILISVLIALSIVMLHPQNIHASQKVAGGSAVLKSTPTSESDNRIHILAIKNVLSRHNSPMTHEAENFVLVANVMDLDPYLLPAIAGVESSFGSALMKNSHNPFGWNVGRTRFTTWSDGIATVGYALRHRYINEGAEDLDAIGHRYAGGSNTWAPKVIAFMNVFEKEEAKIRRYSVL